MQAEGLTSSTDPYDPVPSSLPVGVTPGRTNCCSCELFLNAPAILPLLKNAITVVLEALLWEWLIAHFTDPLPKSGGLGRIEENGGGKESGERNDMPLWQFAQKTPTDLST